MKVFNAYVVECTDKPALSQRVITFCKICVDDNRTNELSVVNAHEKNDPGCYSSGCHR